MFEFLGRGKFAGQNQAVKARFVDNGHVLLATGGVHFGHPFVIIVNMDTNCLFNTSVPKGRSNILANKPRFIVDFHRADFPKFGVGDFLF